MTNKITLELDTATFERMIDTIPIEEKIRLAHRLERQTMGKRLDELFKKIDQRRKNHPVSNKEIAQEIEIVRRKIYGPRSR